MRCTIKFKNTLNTNAREQLTTAKFIESLSASTFKSGTPLKLKSYNKNELQNKLIKTTW